MNVANFFEGFASGFVFMLACCGFIGWWISSHMHVFGPIAMRKIIMPKMRQSANANRIDSPR